MNYMSKKVLYGFLMVLVVLGIISLFQGKEVYVRVIQNIASSTNLSFLVSQPVETSHYIEVLDACGPYFVGECVNARSGPGKKFPVVFRLRTGVVLKVGESIVVNGVTWYKVIFTHGLLYPERIKGDIYVSADFVHFINDEGDKVFVKGVTATSTKRIVVDVSEEMLYAYDGDVLFMKEPISTGLEFTPTPRGTFSVFKMTPSRFMQGPIPGVSTQVYDLPGVPWNMYFTESGDVIHGAYWHDHFGEPWSHGCVNLPVAKAKELYMWADVGMKVTVQN